MDDGAADAVALAALALVGARFRLHGRDALHGLDCIGVIAAALRGAGWEGEVPSGYPLRGGDPAVVAAGFDTVLARGDGRRAGDVLLFAVGPGQIHGAVKTTVGFVHADAGLRRVVERPGAAEWPLIGAWRYIRGGADGDAGTDDGRAGDRRTDRGCAGRAGGAGD